MMQSLSVEYWLEARPFVREQFLAAGGYEPELAGRELARFFLLTTRTDNPIAIINPNIDLLWHKFIEFTEEYGTFCRAEFGDLVHHRSRTATTPVPDEAVRNFYDQYTAAFGSIPDVWESGTPPAISEYGRRLVKSLPCELRWSGWPGRSINALHNVVGG